MGIIFVFSSLLNCFATEYSVIDFGAIGDGQTENAISIQKAIDAASKAGGGVVLFPAGVYLTTTIFIKDNVTLHLKKGAVIKGSTDYDAYPSDIEPLYETFLLRKDRYPSRALILGMGVNNVAIEGEGTIDGNGDHPRLRLKRMASINLIRFVSCKNVRVEGLGEKLKIVNASHWALQPINVDGLLVRNVHIVNYGGNTPDGLPICDSRNVLVDDCRVEADDDAITLKSGTPELLIENITIKNTTMVSRVCGFKFGPQTFGGFKNITITGCHFEGATKPPATQYDPHHGVFINVSNGGYIDGVLVENCTANNIPSTLSVYLGSVKEDYWLTWWPGKKEAKGFGSIRNVTFRNIKATDMGQFGIMVEGRADSKIENVLFENVQIASRGGGNVIPVPEEKPNDYPNLIYLFDDNISTWGMFLRHVDGVKFKDVYLWTTSEDKRPDLYTDDVQNFDPGSYKPQLRPEEEGFKSLFNGENLEGWHSVRAHEEAGQNYFSVDSGEQVIHVYANMEAGSEKSTDCLISDKEYSNYVLKMEYKWLEKRFAPRIDHDRDAGLLFHLHGDLHKIWPNCLEMQLGESEVTKIDDRYVTGDLWVIGKDVQVMNERNDASFYAPGVEKIAVGKGKDYDKAFIPVGNENPHGEWNEITLTVRGGKEAVFELNGMVVNRISDLSYMVDGERVPLNKGHIGLQAEYAELLYRNIRIKEFPIEPAPPKPIVWKPDTSSTFEVGTQIRAWTIKDEGMTTVLDNMQQMAGINNVYMVVVMHAEHRPFAAPEFPHNPARDTWQAEDSRVTFFPDTSRYGSVKPLLSDTPWIRETDWLQLLVDSCRARGLAVGAEVSHYPIPKSLIKAHPDWQQKKVDGTSGSTSRFCPNSPEPRAYVIALFGDLAANYDLDYIQTCQHLFWKDDIDKGGTCFCEHCIAEAKKMGIDLEKIKTVLASDKNAQPERDQWMAFRAASTTRFYKDISEEIARVKMNPKCHLRYNDTYPYRSKKGWDPRDLSMYIDDVSEHLGSLVTQDHQEQEGDSLETFEKRKRWLATDRALIGPDMPLICSIAPRMKATPELVKAGIKVAIEHPARVNGLALKHYDGASFGLMRAFKQGMIDAGVQGITPTIGKECEAMELKNFTYVDDFIEEWGIEISGKGTATYQFDNATDTYDVRISYFDEDKGHSKVSLYVAGKKRASFLLDEDSDCWRWRLFKNIKVKKGDEIKLVAKSKGGENVRLDYIEFIPVKRGQ